MQQQFDHDWANHRIRGLQRSKFTSRLKATWGAIKRDMKHLSGTPHDLCPPYLYNYMFRRFHNKRKIFQKILEAIRLQYDF
jgi:hypothetical protein